MKKVITYGSFDLFHEGHYNLLKRAKALGDYLIVGVTTEQYDESRGKLNIVDSLDKRIENVRQTGFADEIIVEDHPGQKVEDVQKYGIDIFTVGSDWTGAFDHMKQFCEVVYLERMTGFSVSFLFSPVFLHPARVTAKIPTSRIPAITLFPFIFIPSLLFFSISSHLISGHLLRFSGPRLGVPVYKT